MCIRYGSASLALEVGGNEIRPRMFGPVDPHRLGYVCTLALALVWLAFRYAYSLADTNMATAHTDQVQSGTTQQYVNCVVAVIEVRAHSAPPAVCTPTDAVVLWASGRCTAQFRK